MATLWVTMGFSRQKATWQKKPIVSVGWILKNLQVGRMIPGDLAKIHHEWMSLRCLRAGFNNRHDLSMFIFFIFSSHFFHLSFLYGKMWSQWHGTWLARQICLSDGCPKDLGSGHQHSGPGDWGMCWGVKMHVDFESFRIDLGRKVTS